MDELIKREDAIATIGVMYERCDTYDITDYRDLMLESVKVLPSADRPQEWIPLNTELPIDAYDIIGYHKGEFKPDTFMVIRKGADDE